MKNAKRWLPGALISLLLIAAILYFVDLRAVLAAMRAADYRILAAGMACSFLWLAVRAVVWRTLLQDRAPYGTVLLTVGEGYLLNHILPFRLGEIGRAFLLSRKSDLQFSEILPTIVIERAVDLAFAAAILLAALPFVVGAEGAGQIGTVVGVIILLGLGFLYALARNSRRALGLFHRLSARWPAVQQLGGNFLEYFLAGLGVLTRGLLFARFLFWMSINWLIAIGAYFLIIRAFFPQAQPLWGMFGLGAASFGGALTILSGDQSTALAVALTARMYNYLNSGVIGGIGLSREGQTLSGLYRQLMQFRSKGV